MTSEKVAGGEAGPWDVAIVGLGPTGLALAALLGRRGLSVLGLEREGGLYRLPRAGHLDHTALRVLDEIGCFETAFADMIPNAGLRILSAGGRTLAWLPSPPRTPTGAPSSMHFHQPRLDRALFDTAAALPSVTLRHGCPVTEVAPGPDHVALTLGGTRPEQVRARYVVGADGAGSTVRAAAGLALEDFGFSESWMVVDLILARRCPSLSPDTVFVADPARPHLLIELPGMRYRFEFMLLPGETEAELTAEPTVRRLLRPWLGPDDIAAIERAVVYTFRGALAPEWRAGRILLAGDAAHLTPPFLGQGLCSGLRDAANLAWKLDHVLTHGAPAALLDSYGVERAPHVRNVIDTSIRIGEVLCTLDPETAARRDADLLATAEDPRRSPLFFRLGELPQGALVGAGGGRAMPSPRVGATTLDRLAGQRFLVLSRRPLSADPALEFWTALGAHVLDTAGEVPALDAWLDRMGAEVAVARPDRYVLGAGATLAGITDPVRALLAPGLVKETQAEAGRGTGSV